MVGILYKYKNMTYGLCCYCGCFIKVSNKNFCNFGISCGRHATSCHKIDNKIWQLDRDVPIDIKIEYNQKSKCILTRKDEKNIILNNKYQKINQIFKNRRLIHRFDYRDITPKFKFYPDAWCFFCKNVKSLIYIPVYNFAFKILKIPICKNHTKECKYKFTKNAIMNLAEFENWISKNVNK